MSFVSPNFQFNFAEFHLSFKGPLIRGMYYFSISTDRSNKVVNCDEDIPSISPHCLEKITVELSSGIS